MMQENSYINLLNRFMCGMTSAEEEETLSEWFGNACAKEELFSFYQDKWEKAKRKKLPAEVQGRMFHHIKAHMKSTREVVNITTVTGTATRMRWWFYAAAIACILLGIGTFLSTRQPSHPDLSNYIVAAGKGQRASLVLPDGTKAWLNSHTSISYNTEYGKEERIVCLSGEAYFEVAKDMEHRFVVKVDDMEIEALGTSFNVKAYEEDTEWVTTLFEGSVRTTTTTEVATLLPNQHARYNKQDKCLAIENTENPSYARLWRNNELAFEGETLENIAVLLNRMYNVQIHFQSDKIKHYHFSGVIKDNSLDNIFEIISLTAPITYEFNGDTILINEKR